MVFRESFYQVKDLVEERLHDFGIASADSDTMGWTTMLTIAQNTRVTIDVPLVLIYSDFIISGTLETSTYSRIANKTVKLKVGDTIVDTTTTNVNGEYSFTQPPVSAGNHSFQVIFEGTDIYTESQSSIVNRTVEKETTVMNLDAVSTQHYGDTLITGGQLLDNDGQYVANASVIYKLDGTIVNTLTTDAQGRFSITRTIDSFSTKRMSFEFSDTDNYTETSAYVDVDVYQPTLKISSDKNILSYADQDECTLTAQIVEEDNISNNISLSGVEIEFEIMSPGFSRYVGDVTQSSSLNAPCTFRWKNYKSEVSINNSVVIDLSDYRLNSVIHLVWASDKSLKLYVDGVEVQGKITIPLDGSVVTTWNGPSIQLRSQGLGLSQLSEYNVANSHAYYEKQIANTNSSGVATVSYTSRGLGDVTVEAEATVSGSILIQTYAIEDCIKTFKLDGTEPTGTFSRGSITCSNGILSGKSGYVKGFDNTDSWVLSFDVYHISYSLLPLVPTTTTTYDNNYVQLMGYVRIFENGRQRDISYDSGATKKYNEWQNIKIEKENGQYTLYFDDVFVATFTLSWNPSQLGVGFDAWSGSNSGQIKNIKVKPL